MNVLATDAPASIAGHPAHYPNHRLNLVVATGADAKFRCNGCKEVGAGYRYSCEFDQPCDFNLHKDCALAEDTLVHPIFNNNKYKFELRREPPGPGKNERLCDACGTRVHGWYYHCDRNGLDLHPCCAKLPMEFKREELTFELRKEATHRCNICGGRGGHGTFWYYRSTCRTVYLHVRCVKEKLVTCSSEPAGGGVGGGSTSTTPAAHTMTMTSFVQAALQGYSGNNYERTFEILAVLARAILAVIIGDPPTEIITTAAAGLISTCTRR